MNRLEMLAYLAKDSNVLCDVGCDHAYVTINAIKKYNVKKGIAADIAAGPLSMAREKITEAGLIDNVEIILSNGFESIESDFDTAVIAGMGGKLISQILTMGTNKIEGKKLILEPNCDSDEVREFLVNNNFYIEDEYAIVDQNKYYEIIVAMPGNKEYTDFEVKFGPILLNKKPKEFIDFYKDKINYLSKILTKINDDTVRTQKVNEINQYLEVIRTNMETKYILNTINYYKEYYIDDETRPTIVIAPGGGYLYTSPRESEPVAEIYNAAGFHVVVVNYRETKDEVYPAPAKYLAEAIKEIKKDSRVGKIIALGFSAGGHNVLEVTLHHENYGIKPDLIMLGYPVVTSNELYSHKGSFNNLLHEGYNNKELMQYLSMETQVTSDAPDLFLWGTFTDESVDVMNSLLLIEAYKKAGCNVEYHMYPMGGHGLSVCNSKSADGNKEKINPYIGKWIYQSIDWLNLKLK